MTKSNITKITNSQLAQAIIKVKGKKIDLDGYEPFRLIYDCSPPSVTLKSSRQTGKSLSIAGMIVTNSILRSNFGSLMISPLSNQASRFSYTYLDPILNEPLLKKHFMDSSSKKNVYYKSLSNGSYIILGYADSDEAANRIRGSSVDLLLIDEVQDVSYDSLAVLGETLTASEYAFKRYCGTAKTENNTLEHQWKLSNQLEWVVKCDSCGKHAIPSDLDTCLVIVTANPHGPACPYCSSIINMAKGKWIAAKPQIKNHYGFHIPAFCMPVRNRPHKWEEIKEKVKTYPLQKLSNEVMGLASGVGGRILTQREAMACCNISRTAWDTGFPIDDGRGIYMTTLGVDWSVSGSTKSYTIISILGYDYKGKVHLLYAQKLDGIDILEQVARVEQLYTQFQCSMIGSDRGVGVLQGQMMKQHLGEDKVAMVNYVSAKAPLRWDKVGGYYAADRTMGIDTIILKAKMGKDRFETPCWDLTNSFWDDALNVFEEESLSGKRLYRKDPDVCDDFLHSVVFGNIASMVLKGEFTTVDETPHVSNGFDLSQYL